MRVALSRWLSVISVAFAFRCAESVLAIIGPVKINFYINFTFKTLKYYIYFLTLSVLAGVTKLAGANSNKLSIPLPASSSATQSGNYITDHVSVEVARSWLQG